MGGIAFLALAVTFSSGVAMIMKAANTKDLKFGQFLAVNYLVCCLGLLACGAWRVPGLDSALIWSMGVFVGCMYVLSLWLFDRAIATMGLFLPTALKRLSAMLPTIGSLLVFAEQLNLYQIVGLVLAFSCLPLASNVPLRFGQAGKPAWGGMKWGILLFVVYGV